MRIFYTTIGRQRDAKGTLRVDWPRAPLAGRGARDIPRDNRRPTPRGAGPVHGANESPPGTRGGNRRKRFGP